MKLAIDGITYDVRFHHLWSPERKAFVSYCYIDWQDNPDSVPFAISGEAVCSPKDQFNRSIGRKVALTRALGYYWFSENKKRRTALWKAYWTEREKLTGKKWVA